MNSKTEKSALSEPRYVAKTRFDAKGYVLLSIVFFVVILIAISIALSFSAEFVSLISLLAGMIATISSISAYNLNETKKLAHSLVQKFPAEEWALAKPYAVIRLRGDIYLIVTVKQFFGNYLRIYAIKPLFALATSGKPEFRLESKRTISKSKAMEPLQILEIKQASFRLPSTSSKELIIEGEGLIAFGSVFLGKESFEKAKSGVEVVLRSLKEAKQN